MIDLNKIKVSKSIWLPRMAADCGYKIVRVMLSTILKQLVLPQTWQNKHYLVLGWVFMTEINENLCTHGPFGDFQNVGARTFWKIRLIVRYLLYLPLTYVCFWGRLIVINWLKIAYLSIKLPKSNMGTIMPNNIGHKMLSCYISITGFHDE